MKRYAVICFLCMSMTLCGCGAVAGFGGQNGNILQTEVSEGEDWAEPAAGTEDSEIPGERGTDKQTVQGGPYGRISISVPDGWCSETYSIDSDDKIYGLYGIRFYPENVEDGYVEVAYIDFFGVCGTGLKEESATVAGKSVNIGTYDGNEYWDFISFKDEYEGLVALTYLVDDWWSGYEGQVMNILETVSFDTAAKEGGAYVYHSESEMDEIGLSVTLKKISPTGATVVYNQYDVDAATGQLEWGTDFAIERQRDGEWESVPVIIAGSYGFDLVAYVMKEGESAEQELNWEWLYGELAPGEYRLRKQITDFRETGDYDTYTVYTYFILN